MGNGGTASKHWRSGGQAKVADDGAETRRYARRHIGYIIDASLTGRSDRPRGERTERVNLFCRHEASGGH